MGTDSNDVSAQEDQDISAHLERRGKREKEVVKLEIRGRKEDTANPVHKSRQV